MCCHACPSSRRPPPQNKKEGTAKLADPSRLSVPYQNNSPISTSHHQLDKANIIKIKILVSRWMNGEYIEAFADFFQNFPRESNRAFFLQCPLFCLGGGVCQETNIKERISLYMGITQAKNPREALSKGKKRILHELIPLPVLLNHPKDRRTPPRAQKRTRLPSWR